MIRKILRKTCFADLFRYQALNAAGCNAHTLAVAVSSRMRNQSARPLAGLRIGVKDLYFLRGVYSGQGNRAYRECYPKSDLSSDILKRVIEEGGVIVGMTKSAEFGGTQEVVGDWTDYSYSFNSRGDGYFVAVGSSTGSATALAAYSWLDIAIGSDGLSSLIALRTCG